MAATDYNALVQQLYVSYFGRPADFYGLRNFAGQLAALDTAGTLTSTAALAAYVQGKPGSPIATLVGSFGAQPESLALYGSGSTALDISRFVNAIYNNVLHRDADLAGGNYWISQIASGALSRANAALAITEGALANTSAQGLRDAALVRNVQAVATDFTNALDTIAKINAYAGDAAAARARDLLLQMGASGDAATFHATVTAAIDALAAPATLNVLLTSGIDALAGTGANEVYTATHGASAATTTWNALDAINGGGGVNRLLVNDVAGGVDLALASVSNIQGVVLQSSSGLAADAGDLGGWSGLAPATLLLKSALPQTVTVANTTALAVSNNAGVSTIGGSTVTVTAKPGDGRAAAAALVASMALAFDNATSAAQSDAANQNNGAPSAFNMLDAFTMASGVSAADKASVNAAYEANGDDVFGSAAQLAVAAAIDDAVLAAHAAYLAADAASSAAAAVAVADAALNHVTIAGDAITAASISGGSVITVGDNGKGTLATVTLNRVLGDATLTGAALTTVSLTGTASAVTIVNPTVGHAETLLVDGAAAGTLVTDASAASVTVKATGAASAGLALTAAAATALVLGGDAGLGFASGALNAGHVTAVTVGGAGGVSADFAGIAVGAVITATASTGANRVAVAAGQAYAGGVGVDTVTIAAAPTAAITGGAGAADVLVLNMATPFNASANPLIKGFETLALGANAAAVAYDATGYAHLLVANALAGAATFSNVGAGTELTLSAAAAQPLTYSLRDSAGGADALDLSLRGAAAATNTLNAPGLESIHITTTDTLTNAGHAAFRATVFLADAALTTLTVSGDMGLQLVSDVLGINAVDASGLTAGGFEWIPYVQLTPSHGDGPLVIKGSLHGGDTIAMGGIAGRGVTIIETVGDNVLGGSATESNTLIGGSGADSISGGSASDRIVGGGGADTITGNGGADLITVAGDHVLIVQQLNDSGVNNATASQAAELTSTFDVIDGLVAGNRILITNRDIVAANVMLAGTNLAHGANDSIVFAAGTYNAAAGTFSYGANGLDTALTYDADDATDFAGGLFTPRTHFETIILLGYHSSAATSFAGEFITL